MNLDFITKNPIIKNLALGKLKTTCKENAITMIAVIPPTDDNSDFDFVAYNEPVRVIKETEYQTLLKLATE